ncbi:MAG: 3-demethylubiquinone-9 3-O-methyltransferase [Planctomycetes bacterium]|nr:3-demethylubiquinone-9 3-O-methyltransferase [Planctomycetota bacterium]
MTTGADQALFDRSGWWDEDCRAFASLRALSSFRSALLARWLGDALREAVVIDLGCGGGLLSVPLARAGARVLGVDLATQALGVARQQGGERLLAVRGDLEAAPVGDGVADVVLLADVLEHVADPAAAVGEAVRLLRRGGHLFVNTINRTLRSRLFAITLGEGLGYIPRGTHCWRDFIRPAELDAMASAAGCVRVRRVGEKPRLLATLQKGHIEVRETRDLAVGYGALYRKVAA